MLLRNYFLRSYLGLFAKIALAFSCLIAVQAMIYALKKIHQEALPLQICFIFFSKEFVKSFPILLNFSFAVSLVIWLEQLKILHLDIAALVCGWRRFHFNTITITLLTGICFINFFCLFELSPFLSRTIETTIYPALPIKLIEAAAPKKPLIVGQHHVFYVNEHDRDLLRDIKVISLKDDQRFVIEAKTAVIHPNTMILKLKNGKLKNIIDGDHQGQSFSFYDMEYQLSAKKPELSPASLFMSDLIHQKSWSELVWRFLLLLQPVALYLVLFDVQIRLRQKPQMHLKLLQSSIIFVIMIVTFVFATKLLAKERYVTAIFCLLINVLLIILSQIRRWYVQRT